MDTFAQFYLISTRWGFKTPHSLPEGFKTIETTKFQSEEVVQVEKLYAGIELVSKDTMRAGVWILASDCIPRGEFKPEGVEGRRTFFGIPIHEESAKTILDFASTLKVVSPVSVYHGTDYMLENQVAAGLQETYGMLGYGVYCGTFWKAARFACLTQDYVRRQGTVFRAIAFAFKIREYPMENYFCACERCKRYDWAAKIADHGTWWKLQGFDGAHASASTDSSGLCRDGKAKYPLRNEEWVFPAETLVLTHVARIDQRTMPGTYDPMFRDVHIF
jgi:hypothetical protein